MFDKNSFVHSSQLMEVIRYVINCTLGLLFLIKEKLSPEQVLLKHSFMTCHRELPASFTMNNKLIYRSLDLNP